MAVMKTIGRKFSPPIRRPKENSYSRILMTEYFGKPMVYRWILDCNFNPDVVMAIAWANQDFRWWYFKEWLLDTLVMRLPRRSNV